ncbi:MAG: acetyltransferase [Streptomyces oryziradicis]|nr:acetyltransferase [Actinacidiphila oryziradicis]
MTYMSVDFALDPEMNVERHEELVRLWTDVSNAGGAVGFVPPVTSADIRPQADEHLAAVAEGRFRMLAALQGGKLVGTAFFSFNTHRLMRHWAWLVTVMVHPSLQGRGYGAELLRAAERRGREFGLAGIRLGCRSGLGLERFYASAGYKEVGRVPAAIRVSPGDDRDDVTMWLPLV